MTPKLCDFSCYVIKISSSNLVKTFFHEYLIYLAQGYWKWRQIHLKHLGRLKSGKFFHYFAKQFFRPRVTKSQFLLFFDFSCHADNFNWPTDFLYLNKIKHMHYQNYNSLEKSKISKNLPKKAKKQHFSAIYSSI